MEEDDDNTLTNCLLDVREDLSGLDRIRYYLSNVKDDARSVPNITWRTVEGFNRLLTILLKQKPSDGAFKIMLDSLVFMVERNVNSEVWVNFGSEWGSLCRELVEYSLMLKDKKSYLAIIKDVFTVIGHTDHVWLEIALAMLRSIAESKLSDRNTCLLIEFHRSMIQERNDGRLTCSFARNHPLLLQMLSQKLYSLGNYDAQIFLMEIILNYVFMDKQVIAKDWFLDLEPSLNELFLKLPFTELDRDARPFLNNLNFALGFSQKVFSLRTHECQIGTFPLPPPPQEDGTPGEIWLDLNLGLLTLTIICGNFDEEANEGVVITVHLKNVELYKVKEEDEGCVLEIQVNERKLRNTGIGDRCKSDKIVAVALNEHNPPLFKNRFVEAMYNTCFCKLYESEGDSTSRLTSRECTTDEDVLPSDLGRTEVRREWKVLKSVERTYPERNPRIFRTINFLPIVVRLQEDREESNRIQENEVTSTETTKRDAEERDHRFYDTESRAVETRDLSCSKNTKSDRKVSVGSQVLLPCKFSVVGNEELAEETTDKETSGQSNIEVAISGKTPQLGEAKEIDGIVNTPVNWTGNESTDDFLQQIRQHELILPKKPRAFHESPLLSCILEEKTQSSKISCKSLSPVKETNLETSPAAKKENKYSSVVRGRENKSPTEYRIMRFNKQHGGIGENEDEDEETGRFNERQTCRPYTPNGVRSVFTRKVPTADLVWKIHQNDLLGEKSDCQSNQVSDAITAPLNVDPKTPLNEVKNSRLNSGKDDGGSEVCFEKRSTKISNINIATEKKEKITVNEVGIQNNKKDLNKKRSNTSENDGGCLKGNSNTSVNEKSVPVSVLKDVRSLDNENIERTDKKSTTALKYEGRSSVGKNKKERLKDDEVDEDKESREALDVTLNQRDPKNTVAIEHNKSLSCIKTTNTLIVKNSDSSGCTKEGITELKRLSKNERGVGETQEVRTFGDQDSTRLESVDKLRKEVPCTNSKDPSEISNIMKTVEDSSSKRTEHSSKNNPQQDLLVVEPQNDEVIWATEPVNRRTNKQTSKNTTKKVKDLDSEDVLKKNKQDSCKEKEDSAARAETKENNSTGKDLGEKTKPLQDVCTMSLPKRKMVELNNNEQLVSANKEAEKTNEASYAIVKRQESAVETLKESGHEAGVKIRDSKETPNPTEVFPNGESRQTKAGKCKKQLFSTETYASEDLNNVLLPDERVYVPHVETRQKENEKGRGKSYKVKRVKGKKDGIKESRSKTKNATKVKNSKTSLSNNESKERENGEWWLSANEEEVETNLDLSCEDDVKLKGLKLGSKKYETSTPVSLNPEGYSSRRWKEPVVLNRPFWQKRFSEIQNESQDENTSDPFNFSCSPIKHNSNSSGTRNKSSRRKLQLDPSTEVTRRTKGRVIPERRASCNASYVSFFEDDDKEEDDYLKPKQKLNKTSEKAEEMLIHKQDETFQSRHLYSPTPSTSRTDKVSPEVSRDKVDSPAKMSFNGGTGKNELFSAPQFKKDKTIKMYKRKFDKSNAKSKDNSLKENTNIHFDDGSIRRKITSTSQGDLIQKPQKLKRKQDGSDAGGTSNNAESRDNSLNENPKIHFDDGIIRREITSTSPEDLLQEAMEFKRKQNGSDAGGTSNNAKSKDNSLKENTNIHFDDGIVRRKITSTSPEDLIQETMEFKRKQDGSDAGGTSNNAKSRDNSLKENTRIHFDDGIVGRKITSTSPGDLIQETLQLKRKQSADGGASNKRKNTGVHYREEVENLLNAEKDFPPEDWEEEISSGYGRFSELMLSRRDDSLRNYLKKATSHLSETFNMGSDCEGTDFCTAVLNKIQQWKEDLMEWNKKPDENLKTELRVLKKFGKHQDKFLREMQAQIRKWKELIEKIERDFC